ncbi:hypothetical protein HMPREF9374_0732 [Desmospora sp. 8437]|nr:hypothetical protein HMPREF9374_0732 [Desmospora sp. 8437]
MGLLSNILRKLLQKGFDHFFIFLIGDVVQLSVGEAEEEGGVVAGRAAVVHADPVAVDVEGGAEDDGEGSLVGFQLAEEEGFQMIPDGLLIGFAGVGEGEGVPCFFGDEELFFGLLGPDEEEVLDVFVDEDVLMRGGKADVHAVLSLLRGRVRPIYHVFRKGETMKPPRPSAGG